MKKTWLFIAAVVLLSFAIGIYFYPSMPERMASHWDAQGEVNGYMPKLWGLFLMPVISAVMLLFFIAIPRIDPMKANIAKFRGYFDGFIALIISFLFYIYLLTIFWNLGGRFNFTVAIVPAFSVLFYYMGILVEHAKMNWFIGIRTPWTLSSERVWDATHRLGGKLFKVAAIASLLGLLIEKYAILLAVAPAVAFSFYLVVFSYLEYRKEKKR